MGGTERETMDKKAKRIKVENSDEMNPVEGDQDLSGPGDDPGSDGPGEIPESDLPEAKDFLKRRWRLPISKKSLRR